MIDAKGLALIHEWIRSAESTDSQKALQANTDEDIDSLLATTSGGLELLWAMEERQVSPTIRQTVIDRATSHPSESIRDLLIGSAAEPASPTIGKAD